MSDNEVVTLMMVTYNRLELTKRMLDSLFKTTKHPFNLVIVDNGSTDGTVEYLDQMASDHAGEHHLHLPSIGAKYIESPYPNLQQLVIYKNQDNKGIAVGRNQGLKLADDLNTDFYCTIDNDVEVPEGWLQECIDILKANRKYGAIGVNMEGAPYPVVTEGGKTFQCKPRGNLGTACMVFTKALHKMIGFFKEYNKYGLEDSDFGMRAQFVGFKLGYIERPGLHFGGNEDPKDEYRKWKTREHDSRVQEFRENCAKYARRELPVYVKFQGPI